MLAGTADIVLERTERVHDGRLCKGSTVSIGCISNPRWREIVAEVGGPVAMTSANTAGETDDRLVAVEYTREQVGDGVEYILDDEPQGTTTASTILDMTGEPDILRKGDITATTLNDIAGLGL